MKCTKEMTQLVGEFYRILNCEPFFTPGVHVEDGVRWSTPSTVTKLTATLGFLFIRMHSLPEPGKAELGAGRISEATISGVRRERHHLCLWSERN
jgi:hypothetical protein